MADSSCLAQHIVQLVKERIDILELPVNRCKPDISHFINVFQPLHDQFADLLRADFTFESILGLNFY